MRRRRLRQQACREKLRLDGLPTERQAYADHSSPLLRLLGSSTAPCTGACCSLTRPCDLVVVVACLWQGNGAFPGKPIRHWPRALLRIINGEARDALPALFESQASGQANLLAQDFA